MAIIISDIDGTVLDYGKPIKAVVDFVKKYDEVIFMTNRPEEERKKTVADLRKVGIKYSRLIMNTTGEAAPKFKKGAVKELVEEEDDEGNPVNVISAFIDDRLDTRNAIRSLDAKIRIFDPAQIAGKTSGKASLASYSLGEAIAIATEQSTDALAEIIDYLAVSSTSRESIEVPQFIRDNAKRGLEMNKEGYGGDGLTDKTKAEARDMANGKVTLGKCVRMAAWFARHKPDTKADGFKNKKSADYPSAGLVAWLLWGGDSNGSMRAAEWAEKQVARYESKN
jgi:hypothetical protein